ncbi:MAG: hypothetical protein KAW41_03880 [Candidatus Diapherotrites archaeon]|nr:hypothetical protein [Candidatus Diapherotrites archaeon]
MKKEIIAVLVLLAMAWLSMPQLDHHVEPWLDTVVLPGEVEAARWVKNNVDGLFLAGIFGGELVMGIASQPSLVGGDWAANINSPKQMSDMDEFYKTDSADKAEEIWRNYNASYAWFPARQVYAGYGWIGANEEKMSDPRFEVVYTNPEVRVYKLSEST